jgi:chromosome segregation ATPase
MIWLFSVLSVVLVTIMVQLLLVYQKRSSELRFRQEPLRRRIREHHRAMEDTTAGIRRTAIQRLEEVEHELGILRESRDGTGKILGRLEAEVFGRDRPGEAAETEADAEIPASPDQTPDAMADRRTALREARHRCDDVDSQLAALRRELEAVRRAFNRVEARVQRHTGGLPAQGEQA